MAGKRLVAKDVPDVPRDLMAVDSELREIGSTQRAIDKIEGILNEKIEALKAEAAVRINALNETIMKKAEGIYIFSQANKEKLISKGKKKSIELMAGVIKWYFTPPAVKTEDEEAAIAELKKNGLKGFIRVKEEINKDAILADQAKIAGLKEIKIDQQEIFAIVPAETKIELERGKRKFKKKIR
jgi:phage host-nuclease inhibitor protein Gam